MTDIWQNADINNYIKVGLAFVFVVINHRLKEDVIIDDNFYTSARVCAIKKGESWEFNNVTTEVEGESIHFDLLHLIPWFKFESTSGLVVYQHKSKWDKKLKQNYLDKTVGLPFKKNESV